MLHKALLKKEKTPSADNQHWINNGWIQNLMNKNYEYIFYVRKKDYDKARYIINKQPPGLQFITADNIKRLNINSGSGMAIKSFT